MVIDSIFSYINNLKRFPVIFVSPLAYAIGNCSEEIYFGLLKARREDKKLILLYPYNLPFWLKKYKLTNNEIFKVDSEYIYFRDDIFFHHVVRTCVTLVYLPIRLMSLWLRDIFGVTSLSVSYRFPRIGLDSIYEKTNYFSWSTVRSNNWGRQFEEYLPVGLRKNNINQAERKLSDMGIPTNDWFVCVHAREGGFKNDARRREYRNMQISNYIKAFERIIEKGGWVIRMGDDTMTKLPEMERVIDYPFTKFKSDLMDVFLINKCRFFIGSQSGPLDIASLFQKPTLIVNMVNWTYNYPWFYHSRGILKNFYCHTKKRILTIQEIFEGPWSLQDMDGVGVVASEYELYDNSADDIEEAVVEYMDLLESQQFNQSPLQKEVNEIRIKTSYDIFETVRFTSYSDHEELIQKYRVACRVEDSKGAICQKFLEKNWKKSSYKTK